MNDAPQCDGSGILHDFDRETGPEVYDCPGCCMCDAARDESETHFALTTLHRLRPDFLSAAALTFLGVSNG